MKINQVPHRSESMPGYVQPQSVRLFDKQAPLELVCGKKLAPVDVVFETYGTLSPLRDNVILVNHALTGNAHAAFKSFNTGTIGWWDMMIGPGRALDTNKYFVICSNLLGSCYGTTGPMSLDPDTGSPYGLRFPPITIIDMIHVQKALLDYLEIPSLLAIV